MPPHLKPNWKEALVKSSSNKFKWPGGASCAVTLTYDDGLKSQLNNALPYLDNYGIKGTFFPSGAALTDDANSPGWKQAAAAGHEIGCHTIHHPCDCSHDFVRKGFSLQDYSMDRMRAELKENLAIINGFGYKSENYVFAYPCGENSLGEKRQQSYMPLVMEMFTAARGVEWKNADPGSVELYDVPCFGVECDGQGMIEIAEKAMAAGAWAVFLFHGIGGDYISVTTEAHKALLEYLFVNRPDIYTERFGNIAQYVRNNRKTETK
jgi:hypothetical protein